MQLMAWRKLSKRTNHVGPEDVLSNYSSEIELVKPEQTYVQESKDSSRVEWEDKKETKPKTTWIWDRSRQAWVEIIEKPFIEETSASEVSTNDDPVATPLAFSAPDSTLHAVNKSQSVRKILPDKRSPTDVIDSLTSKSKASEWSGYETSVRQLPEEERAEALSNVGTELEESRNIILREAETQAEKIIAWAEERARAWADKIITQAQEKAEERVESIIARAEEKALIQAESIIAKTEKRAESLTEQIIARAEERVIVRAESIIAQAEKKAEAQAQSIIAGAEEKSRLHAENIVARAEGKTEAQAQSIIAETEEKARLRAENVVTQAEEKAELQADKIVASAKEKARFQANEIIAQAKETQQQMLSAAEKQAQQILESTGGGTGVVRVTQQNIAEAPSRQPVHRQEQDIKKSVSAPYEEGTAELVIKPPVDLNIMQKALKRLTASEQIRIMDLDGSVSKGISVKLFTRNLDQLLDTIEALPEVEKVMDLPKKINRICPGQKICPGLQRGSGPPSRRLLVTMRKRSAYFEG